MAVREDSTFRSMHRRRGGLIVTVDGGLGEIWLSSHLVDVLVPHIHHQRENPTTICATRKRTHGHTQAPVAVLPERKPRHVTLCVCAVQKIDPRGARARL